jgi:hypothetical protein
MPRAKFEKLAIFAINCTEQMVLAQAAIEAIYGYHYGA